MTRPLSRYMPALIMLSLLIVVQAQLWIGRGSLPEVVKMREKLTQLSLAQQTAEKDNLRLQAELADLQEGYEAVESKARSDLGMIRPNEIFVQVSPP